MKRIIQSVFFLIIIGLMFSCNIVTSVMSKKLGTPGTYQNSDFCNYFDTKTKIRYGFGNNDSIFYLRLEMLDDTIARNVLQNGLYVYFDETGKKKKELAMNFPMSYQLEGMGKDKKESQKRPMNRSTLQSPDMKNIGQGSAMPDIFEMVPEKAAWMVNGESYLFNWRLEKAPFIVTISKGDIGQLVYEAYIPISQFMMQAGNSAFSLGVEIQEGNDLPSGEKEGIEMPNNGRGGGGPGGGGPGGGGPGGGGPGGMPGGDENTKSINKSASQSFWTLVCLNKEQ
jgi:hypothetical protein